MLNPKIIQLPDYSEYIGKEFLITENITIKSYGRPILKGVRFIIKKIENSKVTIKVSNTKEELKDLGMLEYDFNRVIKDNESQIKTFHKILKLWSDSPKMFVKKSSEAHCICTGYYGILPNHPSKFGIAAPYFNKEKGEYYPSDSIMTLDYKRSDNLLNIYSYQKGTNTYYSKECYEFMLKGKEIELEDWKNRNKKYEKWVLDWILEKTTFTISTLNKISFEIYK